MFLCDGISLVYGTRLEQFGLFALFRQRLKTLRSTDFAKLLL